MISTEDGITTPSGGDEVKIVQDLSTMASTIQDALNKRANMYKGTSADRTSFTADAQDGVLWKDTNGTRALWVKQGTGWEQIYPDARNMISVGSWTQETSPSGQFQMRRYYNNTGNNAHVNLLVHATESIGFIAQNWHNRQSTSALRVHHDGQVSTSLSGQIRELPFSTLTGSSQVEISQADTVHSHTVTFSPGRFTKTPIVVATPATGVPASVSLSVGSISTSGFTIYAVRHGATTNVNVEWIAMQRVA